MASRFLGPVRRFSASAAARGNLVQAPIQLFGVEGRYAHALYSAASKQKQLDSVEKELIAFQDLVSKNEKLADFLVNPTINKIEKSSVLGLVCKSQKSSDVTSNFLGAMAENGRLTRMKSIFGAFSKIMSAHRGEVVCSVTTAKPLDASNMKQLESALGMFLKKGETLQLSAEVDPTIIGGMIVNIADKYVDMSTASKITTYTNLIKQAV